MTTNDGNRQSGDGSDGSGRGTDALFHVTAEDELGEGERISVDVRGREITVFRLDGDLHALLDYCPHQGGPLCEGRLGNRVTVDEDFEWSLDQGSKTIRCPWHGWGFDPETGNHVVGSEIDTKYRVPAYDVVTRDGEVYLDTG